MKFHWRVLGTPAPVFPGFEVDLRNRVPDRHRRPQPRLDLLKALVVDLHLPLGVTVIGGVLDVGEMGRDTLEGNSRALTDPVDAFQLSSEATMYRSPLSYSISSWASRAGVSP